jgi:methanogenic corrinoid protein MtbC1
LVKPLRTETNRRLYSEEDITLLTLLREATHSGHSIGSIADLDQNGLRRLLGKEPSDSKVVIDKFTDPAVNQSGRYLEESIRAVVNFDAVALERLLLRASADLTQPVLIRDLVIPMLEKIGELWQKGSIGIMHEHLATAIIAPFLSNLRNAYRPDENAPVLIVCTPPGQLHELGALIIALVAAAEGWRVVYLGMDTPAVEIAAAAVKENSQVVALSIIYPPMDPVLIQELLKLPTALPVGVDIVVGGRGTVNYQEIIDRIGAKRINRLEDFRRYLSTPLK